MTIRDLSKSRFVEKKVVMQSITLIGMRGDTFISLSFLDQILSAEFLTKIFKKNGGEN